jgi:SAM-dependent methyltransferase
LKLLGGLRPGSNVFDIGCGCGQIALQLIEELDERGTYVGCDISSKAITWCTKRIAHSDPRFSFFHIDVRNELYNPGGTMEAASFRFPVQNRKFDVILLKSVFTHMLREGVRNYLSQIPLLLSHGGRCIASFFLIRDTLQSLVSTGKETIRFASGPDQAYYVDPEVPEALVAYDETEVMDMITYSGLRLVRPVEYGSWAGEKSALSHQDIVVLQANK